MTTVKCTEFVKRQTKDSPFSYLATPLGDSPDERTWRALEVHAEECIESPGQLDATFKQGYKPGVLIVSFAYGALAGGYRFYSGVVTVTPKTQLSARFAARRDNEAPFLDVLAHGEKTEATHVDLILYSRALLLEEGEQVPEGVDYQIVSINARTQEAPEPMTPMAMARNFLALPGGTKAEYTAEQFAEAIVYWSTHAMHGGKLP